MRGGSCQVKEGETMRLVRFVLCFGILGVVLGCAPTVDVTEQNKQVG